MKFQTGDDIIVLHSNEEGKVVEIINDKMVLVEVRGVKFPAYTDQIDFPYFRRFTGKKIFPEKKKEKKYIDDMQKEKSKSAQTKIEEGVWISLIPKFTFDEFGDEVVELFKLYLVNKTEKGYHFIYRQQFLGETAFELKNDVLSFQDFYLHDIPFESLNDSPSLDFEFSLLKPDKKKEEFYETNLKLKPKQVFQRIEELKQKNEPTITYELFKTYPDKAKEEKPQLSPSAQKAFKLYEASQIKQNLEPARTVVDLHVEKLTDDWQRLSNFEILTTQLKEFEKWYDLAVAHRQPNLVVIHGIGTGRLREEIHEILKTKKEVKTFVNQYDARFGYGATEIFFQY